MDRMVRARAVLDQCLGRFSRAGIVGLAACGVLIVAWVDHSTGYEVSLSLLYVGPVALAAWYGGRGCAIAIAVFSCVSWYAADMSAGHEYSHPAIPVWNALVRLGFFLISGLLLSALRDSLRDQRQLAQTDSLTGLFGRRAFQDRLEHELALLERRKGAVTLAYLDLDDFKAVNDTFGHAEGDRVLRTTGQVIRNSVRRTDIAARLGGDEFALVLTDTDSPGARQVISKLAGELQAAFEAHKWPVTCSIGVVTFADGVVSEAEAVAAADAQMYAVKRGGKGAVAFSVHCAHRAQSAAADAP